MLEYLEKSKEISPLSIVFIVGRLSMSTSAQTTLGSSHTSGVTIFCSRLDFLLSMFYIDVVLIGFLLSAVSSIFFVRSRSIETSFADIRTFSSAGTSLLYLRIFRRSEV